MVGQLLLNQADRMSRTFIHDPALPHMRNMPRRRQDPNVIQRIRIQSNEIRIIPFPQLPSFRRLRTQSQRPVRSRGLYSLQRRHTSFDMIAQFLAIETLPHQLTERIPRRQRAGGIRADGALDAFADGDLHGFPLRLGDESELRVPDGTEVVLALQAVLDNQPRRNENSVLLNHQLGRFLVQVTPMLNRLHSSPQRSHNPRFAVTMRADDPLAARRFVHHGFNFLVGELLVDGVVEFGADAARGADFDDFGARAELHADGFEALGDTVGGLEGRAVVAEVVEPGFGEGVEVCVAACGAVRLVRSGEG